VLVGEHRHSPTRERGVRDALAGLVVHRLDPAVIPGGLNPGSATPAVGGRTTASKYVHVLISETRVTQCGKRDFADMVKLRILRQGDPLGLSGGPTAITRGNEYTPDVLVSCHQTPMSLGRRMNLSELQLIISEMG